MQWLAREIFFGVRSNVIVLVKGKMFGIFPDRHTWMLELSWAGLAIKVKFGQQTHEWYCTIWRI